MNNIFKFCFFVCRDVKFISVPTRINTGLLDEVVMVTTFKSQNEKEDGGWR
jgi:hypothetical protein